MSYHRLFQLGRITREGKLTTPEVSELSRSVRRKKKYYSLVCFNFSVELNGPTDSLEHCSPRPSRKCGEWCLEAVFYFWHFSPDTVLNVLYEFHFHVTITWHASYSFITQLVRAALLTYPSIGRPPDSLSTSWTFQKLRDENKYMQKWNVNKA